MWRDIAPPIDHTLPIVTPYDPGKPPKAAAAPRTTTPKVDTTTILAVVLTVPASGGASTYRSSQPINWPYTIRWVAIMTGTAGGTNQEANTVGIRSTDMDTNDAAAWNAGRPLLDQLGNDDTLAGVPDLTLGPLWIPVSTTPHRIIVQLNNVNPVSRSCTVVLGITPSSEWQPVVQPLPTPAPLASPTQTTGPLVVSGATPGILPDTVLPANTPFVFKP